MSPDRYSQYRPQPQGANLRLRLSAIACVLIGRGPARPSYDGRQRDRRRDFSSRAQWIGSDPRLWFVRKKVSVRSLPVYLAALCALVWIGHSIIVGTAAKSLALSSPSAALEWVAAEPSALNQLAIQELNIQNGDLVAAQEWARRALRVRPLDDQSLLLLALIAERGGDSRRADLLVQIAGARTWRNPATQLWLYQRNIHLGDFATALLHADAIIRADPSLETQVASSLAGFTAVSPAFDALTQFLETAPPWRGRFLVALSSRLDNSSRLDQLYSRLAKSNYPPIDVEEQAYLNRLVRDDHFQKAYALWHDALPPAQREDKRNPYNGDFQYPLDGSPFGWKLDPAPGTSLAIVEADDGKTHALRVQFSGARVDFANVSQLQLLASGRYHFSVRAKADELHAPRGLWWRIYCANGIKTTLGNTDLIASSTPWTDYGVDFTVPADGCAAQWLQLELPARIASEKEIEGQIWYQSLRITPVAGGAAHGL